MPPRVYSRHSYCVGFRDVNGPLEASSTIQLNDREPYAYRNFPDNAEHVVSDGDNLFNLAARYFAGVDSPGQFWWVIADFQPDPIIDPTIALAPGTSLVIPSLETLQTRIFNEARRAETGL